MYRFFILQVRFRLVDVYSRCIFYTETVENSFSLSVSKTKVIEENDGGVSKGH